MKKQTAGRDRLGELAPKFAELNDDVLFGEVWSREDKLSARDRSLVTIAALFSAGLYPQLESHIRLGKEHGLTEEEVVEVITQLAFYCGWPKAWSTFPMIKKISRIVDSNDFIENFGEDAFKILADAHILINSSEEEQIDIDNLFVKHNPKHKSKVKALSLIMSEECPFRCIYCIHFANSKHYYNKEKMMTFEIAKSSIDSYIKLMLENGESDFYINFGGGEPLLNYPLIATLLPYIKQCEALHNIKIKLGINTNLALLTKEMAETLTSYDVEIATSLDGTKKGNDKVRLSKNLSGTYDSIIRGFNVLKELDHPLDGFAMTVTEANLSDIDTEIIDWAAALKMTEVRIDIDVVGIVNSPMSEVVQRLTRVRKYAKEKGISVIGFWSRPAENLGLLPEKEDIGFCGGERGNSLCVAPSGQVFPCGYSNYQLGNYQDIPTIYDNSAYVELLAISICSSSDELIKI